MKSKIILGLVILGGLALMAAPAEAVVAINEHYKITQPYSTGSGGPFYMEQTTDALNNPIDPVGSGLNFYTFCVQRDETFSPGNTYKVSNIQTVTEAANPDHYITGYAAWLYTQVKGSLSDLTTYNTTEMVAIQRGIWSGMVQGHTNVFGYEIGIASQIGTSSSEYVMNASTLSTLSGLGLDWATYDAISGPDPWAYQNYIGDIQVLNMANGYRQDMLGTHPLGGGGIIPEPASILVWSLVGAGCAGAAARRRRSRFGRDGSQPGSWPEENRQAIHQIINRGRQL